MQATLTKIKKGMNFLLSRIAAVLLSAMTLLVLYQVFTRYVLNSPAAFTEEIREVSVVSGLDLSVQLMRSVQDSIWHWYL